MANNKQQPQFLGGGPKFNRAGAQPLEEETSKVPPAPPPYRKRAWITAAVLLVLIGLLYAIMVGPNGLTVSQGQGGISPSQHTTGPENGAAP